MKEYRSLHQIQQDIEQESLTCEELVGHYLQKIESQKHLNIFLEVWGEDALEQARKVDEKLKQGTAGKLAGMVVALKDNICYEGHKVSAASKILKGFTSLYSATVVERLLAEDAILIGRTNCDEFAMGSSNENSAYGKVLNPLDEDHVPGGSSGGSAAAVAAGTCLVALGSDTGGSVRQPASFCGVTGFKPTYGRVSRWGLIAFASSFDQIGPITYTTEDAARVMEVIAGADGKDATASAEPVDSYSQGMNWDKSTNIAYLGQCLEAEGLDPEVRDRFFGLMESLKEQGHSVSDEDFPYLRQLVPSYFVLATAEASSNLSRYAGMLYGHRTEGAESLDELISKSRSEGFGPEVQRRVMTGTFVLSEGYYDAYYAKAQKVRRLIQETTFKLLEQYDFIAVPTTPTAAFRFGDKKDPLAMYLADIFTVQASLAGNPAITIPMGKTAEGLPLGLQIMGRPFQEKKLFQFAHYLENQLVKTEV